MEDSNFPYKAAEEAGIQESEMRSVVNRWRYDRKLDRVKHIAEMLKQNISILHRLARTYGRKKKKDCFS